MNRFYQQLLKQPEGKTLEFKQDLSSPKPMMKAIVAFANTAGGRLIIGLSDDRKILGVDDPLSQEERLCSMIADSIAPRLVPNIEMVTIKNKTILIAEVFLRRVLLFCSEKIETVISLMYGCSVVASSEMINQ